LGIVNAPARKPDAMVGGMENAMKNGLFITTSAYHQKRYGLILHFSVSKLTIGFFLSTGP
jgi:hypothetical protein